ncbi:unnamed protein product [Closterium sp. NIES-53]
MTVADRVLPLFRRMMSTASPPRKVTVLGAAGGIGNPLSLLLKMNPLITDLALYDVTGMPGVVADLSHICTRTKVRSYLGPYELPDALRGSHVVLVLAGVPYRSSMGDEDRFCMNAGIVRGLCESIAKHCPEAVIGVITNPLNATVPIAAEAMAGAGKYDARRLLGITSLHSVRAIALLAEATGLKATDLSVPVVGGSRDNTIVPLFSQCISPIVPFVAPSHTCRHFPPPRLSARPSFLLPPRHSPLACLLVSLTLAPVQATPCVSLCEKERVNVEAPYKTLSVP